MDYTFYVYVQLHIKRRKDKRKRFPGVFALDYCSRKRLPFDATSFNLLLVFFSANVSVCTRSTAGLKAN